MRVPYAARVVIAVAIDAGIVASVVAGVLSVARTITRVNLVAGWADSVVVIGMIAIFYLVATRRGTGATVGETLLSADHQTFARRSIHAAPSCGAFLHRRPNASPPGCYFCGAR